MKRQYHAYLLRLWIEGDDSAEWRIVLENAQTRERHTFADLSAVTHHLQQQTKIQPQNGNDEMIGRIS